MLFNSIDFLIFFPAVLLVYFIVPHRIRPTWLLLSSYYFYMSWNPVHGILLLAVTAVTYLGAWLMQRMDCEQGKKKRNKKIILVAEVITVIGLLGYFKYTGFFLDSINVVLAKFRIAPVEIEWNIALPIGISFYTLTALGYLIDVYRGKSEAEHNFLRYALFVSFFPQILSGPIERSTNLLRQLRDSSIKCNWNTERIASGFITMLWGFFLKLVIADRIAVIADTTFGRPECYGTFGLVLGAVSYGIQIYCDFSSYSLIALGAAKTLGFDLINNFETPYFAQSVTEFWHRWHISLSTWLRDYVYISMGGNRCSKWHQYWNILVTFMVSGLWHGANWTFIVWGIIYGMLMVVEKLLYRQINRIPKIIGRIYTLSIVNILWMFFWLDSIDDVLYAITKIWKGVFSGSWVISESLKQCFLTKEMSAMIYLLNNDYISNHGTSLAMIVVVCVSTIICQFPINSNNIKYKANTRTVFTTVILATWCFISMSVRTAGFIYSGF